MLTVASAAALLLMVPHAGQAGDAGNIHLVQGLCTKDSHTAEGPVGADLTKRQSRFYCDAAVINMFDNYKGHIMVQFALKGNCSFPSASLIV